MAYTPLPQRAANIGDIEVNFDDEFVQVCVDDRVVLFISREHNSGLSELANVLQQLS